MVQSFYMERLPYIDEHSTCVGAGPERTWAALVAVGRAMHGPAGPLGWLMGLQPARASGDWRRGRWRRAPRCRDSRSSRRARRRVWRCAGRHRFSRYALVFELEDIEAARARGSRARSWGGFPGVHGLLLSGSGVGSGAHRVVVRRLLRRIEARACSA